MTSNRSVPIAGLRKQSGLSMIEVLVTLVVVSAGLLSLAFLQAQAVRFVSDANSRTHASMLASDITDRMRVNAEIADQYAVSDLGDPCNPLGVSVTDELNCWYRSLATALPNGTGSVTDEGGGRYTIRVSWSELPSGVTDSSAATSLQRTVSWTVDIQ